MLKPPMPANEAERLEAVESYGLMDTLPEQDFDDIARIASEVCGTPISLVTLVGEAHQWFKAHHGTDFEQTPRDLAFCSYAILEPGKPMVVPDARLDERFRENPLTTGPTQVVFYAGVPLVNPEGFALGTLCVIDQKPHQLSEAQLRTLQSLANTSAQLFELRRKIRQQAETQRKLEVANQEAAEIAYVLSHDMRSPLNSIVSLLEILKEENGGQMDESGRELLSMVQESAINLNIIAKSTIDYLKKTRSLSTAKDEINFHELVVQLISLLRPPSWVHLHYPTDLSTIQTSRVALQHTLANLLDNAIKYCDKEECHIRIEVSEDEKTYHFSVADNGPGIDPGLHAKVFKMFQTLGKTDRTGKKGTGIGLAIVRRMVEKLGGNIGIHTPMEGGTRFNFSLPK